MKTNFSVDISICIANYNGESVIIPCIDSILNQECSGSIEILIHDDASTDNSVSLIQEHYPDIKLIASSTNQGFCKSNNILADVANGKYILFLNNDTELLPNALESLLDYAQEAKEPLILGLPQYDMEHGELIDMGSRFDLFLNPVPNLDNNITDVGMIIGACLWVPHSLWIDIGGFPEWYNTLTEDLYVCLVAHIWGYKIKVIPSSGFKHWVGYSLGGGKVKQGSLSTTYKRRRLSERNKTYTMILCYPAVFIAFFLPFHLLILLIEGLLLAVIKGNTRVFREIYLPTFRDVWKNRKFIWSNRKLIQSKYSISLKEFFSIFVWYPYKLKMLLKFGLPSIK